MKILQKGRSLIKSAYADNRIRRLVLIFVYSFAALSLWSNFLITKVLHSPFFLYEVFFIPPVVMYVRKNGMTFFKRLIDRRMLIAGGVLAVFLAVGILRNPSYLIAQVTTYRVWIYFLVIILICFRAEMPDLDTIFAACFGAVCGDTLFCLISPNGWSITPLNLIALAVVVCIPLVQGKYGVFAVGIAVCVVDAFLSGFRISFVVIAAAYIFGLLFSVVCSRRKKDFILFGITVAGAVIVFVFFDPIAAAMQSIFHIDEFAFFRVTQRLKALIRFDFVSSQDAQRLKCFEKPFDLFLQRVIPRGLVGKGDGTYGAYKDVPIVFLYDSFGSVAAWFVSAFVGCVGAWNIYASYKKRTSPELGFLGAMFPVIVVLFLLNGCFIMDTYEVCISAVILGYWLKNFLILPRTDTIVRKEK